MMKYIINLLAGIDMIWVENVLIIDVVTTLCMAVILLENNIFFSVLRNYRGKRVVYNLK